MVRHSWNTWRRAILVLVAFVSAVAAVPAAASPTLEDALSFVRRELSRICDDDRLSRFDRLDRDVYRDCNAFARPGAINLELRFRAPEGDRRDRPGSRRSGVYETALRYHRRSRFFCGLRERGGRVGLFFSCESEVRVDGQACVTRREVIRRVDTPTETVVREQSVAKLFEVSPDECAVLQNALNFVVVRTRIDGPTDLRSYFGAR